MKKGSKVPYKPQNERTKKCHDNLLFWCSPEGGNLDFAAIGRECDLDKSTVKCIARRVEEENGLPRYSLTKNQKMSKSLREHYRAKKESEEKENTEMANEEKGKILNNARSNNLGYEEVAKKLGVKTREDVDAIIDKVIVKANERKQFKNAFSENSERLKETKEIKETKKNVKKTPEVEMKKSIEKLDQANSAGDLYDMAHSILKNTEEVLDDLYAYEKRMDKYAEKVKGVQKEISDGTLKIKKEAEKIRDEFLAELEKVTKEKIETMRKKVFQIGKDAESESEELNKVKEDLKSRVLGIEEEAKKFREQMKSQIVKVAIDLGTGEFVTMSDHEDVATIEDEGGKIYHQLMDSDAPEYDLMKGELKIVAKAKAIMAACNGSVVEFTDDEFNPLPGKIAAAINLKDC